MQINLEGAYLLYTDLRDTSVSFDQLKHARALYAAKFTLKNYDHWLTIRKIALEQFSHDLNESNSLEKLNTLAAAITTGILHPCFFGASFFQDLQYAFWQPENLAQQKQITQEIFSNCEDAIALKIQSLKEERGYLGKRAHLFKFSDKEAATVYVVGSFNRWLGAKADKIRPDSTETNQWSMEKTSTGEWQLWALLPPGKHEYKFVVNSNVWHPNGTNNNLVLDIDFTKDLRVGFYHQ